MSRVNNKEKYKNYDHQYYIKHKRPKSKIGQAEQKIAELEAKLAELREQITILDEENSKTFMKSVNAWRENAELKQQLAEKEKQLKELPNKIIKRVEELSVFDFEAYEEMDFRRYIISEMALDNILKEYGANDILVKNQDKIELLEKVKEFCETNCDKCDDLETGAYCGKVIGLDNVLYMGDMSLYDYIDTLIKEIKGENK